MYVAIAVPSVCVYKWKLQAQCYLCTFTLTNSSKNNSSKNTATMADKIYIDETPSEVKV
jgi:hypothetical protein